MGDRFEATEKQAHFIEAALSGLYSYMLLGGGIRGGKSYGGIGALIVLCRVFPGSRWAIVRKDLPVLRRNTIPTFNKIRPTDFVGEINGTTWESTCSNGSKILFFPESLRDDPDLNRFHGLEVNGFLLEECDELAEKTFYKAIERAGSWLIPGAKEQPHPLILATVNPTAAWPKKVFYDPYMSGTIKPPYFYQPATIEDNPYIPAKYKESLKNLPQTEYDRFVKGSWDFLEEPDQLIRADWVWKARDVEPAGYDNRLGVDVARFGGDATVLCHLRGNALNKMEEFRGMSIDRTAAIATIWATENGVDAQNVRIDSVGLGAGVVDIMVKGGWNVKEVISGASMVEREDSVFRFANLRSQMWWEFREKLRLGLFSLPVDVPQKLVGDLCAPRYSIKADKTIAVESKDEIKARIGRSTDFGDALVYAAFDFPVTEAIVVASMGIPVMSPFR